VLPQPNKVKSARVIYAIIGDFWFCFFRGRNSFNGYEANMFGKKVTAIIIKVDTELGNRERTCR